MLIRRQKQPNPKPKKAQKNGRTVTWTVTWTVIFWFKVNLKWGYYGRFLASKMLNFQV